MTAALEEIVLHPSDPLLLAFRMMALGGAALYARGVVAGAFGSHRVIPRERLVALTIGALLLIFGGDLDGVYLVVALNVVFIGALVVEHPRIEGPSAQEG